MTAAVSILVGRLKLNDDSVTDSIFALEMCRFTSERPQGMCDTESPKSLADSRRDSDQTESESRMQIYWADLCYTQV